MKGLPPTTPRAAEPEDTIQNARVEALGEIFRYGAVIAGATALTCMSTSIGAITKAPPLWYNLLVGAGFLVLWQGGEWPYRLRAGLLIGLLYAAAIGAFWVFGLGGSGAAFLVAASVLAAIFLGFRLGTGATVAAGVVGAGFTLLYLGTPFQPLVSAASLNTWVNLLAIGGNLVLVLAILIAPQRPLWESQSFVVEVGRQKQELLDTRATLQRQAHQLELASSELASANLRLQDQSQALERRARQLSAAAEIGRAATSTFDLPTLLETSINLIRDRFGFYHASVFIIEPGSDVAELRESTGEAGRALKARKHKLAIGSKSLVGTATATRQPVIVQDVTSDPNYYPNPLLPATRAEAVLPLLRGDSVIGALDVQSTAPNAFIESDLAILSTMADQLAVAVQNARLYSETQTALAENAALFKISAALAEANSLQDIVGIVAKHALPKGASRLALVLVRYGPDGQPADLDIRGYYDADSKRQRVGTRVPVATTPLVAKLGFNPLTITDIYSDPQMDPVTLETLAQLEMIATCFVPLHVGGHLVGALLASSDQPTEFNPQEITLLQSITDQIVVTMEKLRLLDETQRRAEQLAAASDIGRTATSTFDLPALLASTVNLIRDRFGFYHASVFIVEPGSNVAEIRESTGEAGRKLKERKHKLAIGSNSLVGKATASRQPVIVQDVRADPNYYPNPLLPDTRAEAVVPMLSGETVIGAVDVQSTLPNIFIESEVAILTTIVGQLAVAVQNARLYVETQTRLNELATLNQISRAISSTINLDEVFAAVRDQLANALGVDNLYLGLYDEPRDLITFPFMLERGQLIPFEPRTPSGRTRYLIQSGKSLRLEGEAAQVAEQLQRLGISPSSVAKSYVGVPMQLGGRVLGVLVAQDYDRINAFNANHERILTTIADQLVVAIQNARLYAETQDRLSELATLNQLSRAFTSSIDIEQIYQTVRAQVADVMNVTDIYLALYDESHDQVSFPFMIDNGQPVEVEPAAPRGLTGHIIRTREPLLLQGDPAETARQLESLGAATTGTSAAQSYFGVPLIAGQRVIGVLAVQDQAHTLAFDVNHQRILTTIADQLAVTLQNARLYTETQVSLAETEALYEASADLNTADTLEGILDVIRKYTVAGAGTHIVSISLFDQAATETTHPAVIDVVGFWSSLSPEAAARLPRRFQVADFPLFDTALHADRPTLVEDWDTNTEMSPASRALFRDTLGANSMVFAPLRVGDQWIGYLNLLFQWPRKFAEADIRRLMALAGQSAVTINSLRLFAQTQAALAENATLFKVSRALSTADSIQTMLEAVVNNAMPTGCTTAGLLWLNYDAHGQIEEIEIRGHMGITGEYTHLGVRLPPTAGPVVLQLKSEPLVIRNVDTDPDLDPASRDLMHRMGFAADCYVPINIDGRLTAVLSLAANQPVDFNPRDIAVLRGISDLLAVTLQKLQLSEETRRRAEQLAAAAEIGRAATASFDLPSVLATTVNLIRDRFGFYHASIFIIPPGSAMAELRESTGEAGRQLKARRHKLAVGSKSLVGAATASRQPVIVQDVRADPTYYPNPLLPETRAEAVIPLIASDTVVGAVDVQSTSRGAFSPGDVAVLNTIAGQLAVAVQNASLYEQTARWATREQLSSQITNKIRAVSAGDIDGMLRTAVTELRQALGTSHGAVQILSGRATTQSRPTGTTGEIKRVLDQIIGERSFGDPVVGMTIRAKLMLKGVNPDKYTTEMPDDPAELARIKQIAADMQVAVQ